MVLGSVCERGARLRVSSRCVSRVRGLWGWWRGRLCRGRERRGRGEERRVVGGR